MKTIRLSYTSSGAPRVYRGGYDEVIYLGRLSSSQDGIIVSPVGIAPTHTAGHGNCPKIIVEIDL